jgi:hypothetical protein
LAQGKEEECLEVLSNLRRLPSDSELVQLEFLEIKAQHVFERETSISKFPNYQDGSFKNNLKLGFHAYASLLTNTSLRKRVIVAVFIMVFQQCKSFAPHCLPFLLMWSRVWNQCYSLLRFCKSFMPL